MSLQSLNVALRSKSARVCETQKIFFLMKEWELVLKEKRSMENYCFIVML